jgi:hypothetical protein
MPVMHITRDDCNKVTGVDEKHARAWGRFYARLQGLTRDTVLIIKWWEPRSPKFHRFHFAILGAIFKAQDQFAQDDALREWLQVGAGHCMLVPGPAGKMVALPLSIDFEHMDDVEFGEHHASVKKFARSVRATRFLWPHLSDVDGGEMMEVIFDSFEL